MTPTRIASRDWRVSWAARIRCGSRWWSSARAPRRRNRRDHVLHPLCDQASGADLDPGGEAYQPGRGGAGVGGGFDPSRRVGADAGDKVGAGGVIDWGHHAGDVKRYGGGGEYELVGEDATLDAETAGTRFDGRGPGGLPIPPPPPGCRPGVRSWWTRRGRRPSVRWRRRWRFSSDTEPKSGRRRRRRRRRRSGGRRRRRRRRRRNGSGGSRRRTARQRVRRTKNFREMVASFDEKKIVQ